MQIVEVPLTQLKEAPWNANVMDDDMTLRLWSSVQRYGLVVPLVTRPIEEGVYEVLSGNQRLQVARDERLHTAPCVVVDLDDAHARLLAQALNRIHGDDDLGLRAELLRTALEQVPEREVLDLLPESAASLKDLASLGQGDLAASLRAFQREQGSKAHLRHYTAQLTDPQMEVVRCVLDPFLERVSVGDQGNPNRQGLALVLLCESYLELLGERR